MENWLFNVFLGKVVARACVTVASFVASSAVQAALAHYGVHGVTVDPVELNTAAIALGHASFEWFKAWRQKPSATVPLPNQP
jgi:hypothetical protein